MRFQYIERKENHPQKMGVREKQKQKTTHREGEGKRERDFNTQKKTTQSKGRDREK